MRKIREVLRLRAEEIGDRQIAVAIGCARSTVRDCVRRCREAGLAWPLPAELTEETLYVRLYHRQVPLSKTPAPDFARLCVLPANRACVASTVDHERHRT